MDVKALIEHATDDEVAVIARVVQRAQESPAILVTLNEGGRKRRYVVDREDENRIRPLTGLCPEDLDACVAHSRDYFGGQWLRSYGRVDEMYRTLGLYQAVKVEAVDRAKVWGR